MPRTKLDRGYQNRLMQERIYGKMRRQGITQAMVARKLGCTQSALSKKITALKGELDKTRQQYDVYCDIRDTYYRISKSDYLSNLVEEECKRREPVKKKNKSRY